MNELSDLIIGVFVLEINGGFVSAEEPAKIDATTQNFIEYISKLKTLTV